MVSANQNEVVMPKSRGAVLLFRPVLDLSRTEDTSASWGDVHGQRKWNFSTNGTIHLRPARLHRAHRDLWKRSGGFGIAWSLEVQARC